MSFFHSYLILCIFTQSTYGNFYSGQCFKEKIIYSQLICEKALESYKIIAVVPTLEYSTDLFDQYFGSSDCLTMKLSCNSVDANEIELNLMQHSSQSEESCYSVHSAPFKIHENSTTTFDLFPIKNCHLYENVGSQDKFFIVEYIMDIIYAFLTCKQINETTMEQGVIIFLSESVLNHMQAPVYLEYILSSISSNGIQEQDFIYNNFDYSICVKNECDAVKTCTYLEIYFYAGLLVITVLIIITTIKIYLNVRTVPIEENVRRSNNAEMELEVISISNCSM